MAKDGQRNTKIIGGLLTAAGVYVAVKKNALLGIAIATGGLLSGFGTFLVLKMMQMLPVKSATKVGELGAVAYDNMQAVAYDNMQAVAYDNMQGTEYEGMRQLPPAVGDWESMGDPVPAAPWDSPHPFG